MKSFFWIYVLCLVVLTSAEAPADTSNSESEEVDKYIVDQATLCQMEYNATDIDIKELLGGAEPKTKIAKCLNGCLMNKLGVLDDANKLVPEKLQKIVVDERIMTKDGKMLISIVPDKCECAAKILTCLNIEAKKRGFDKNVF